MTRTPDFATVIRQALDRRDSILRVSIPGIITSFDKDTFLCNVQPLLKDVDTEGRAVDLPIINNVRLWVYRVGLAVIYLPVRVGDKVGLIFSDRSLDLWEDSDGENTLDPQDTRKHNLTDAWAIPGLYPTGDVIPSTVDPADIRIILYDIDGNIRSESYIGGDTGDIVTLPERDFRVGDKDATEHGVLGDILKTELSSVTQSFIDNAATIVSTGVGPGQLNPVVVTALTTFITNLINILSSKMRLV